MKRFRAYFTVGSEVFVRTIITTSLRKANEKAKETAIFYGADGFRVISGGTRIDEGLLRDALKNGLDFEQQEMVLQVLREAGALE